MSKWAADAMGVAQFNAAGIGNRALASMAGNSMHAASVACLFHALLSNLRAKVPEVDCALLSSLFFFDFLFFILSSLRLVLLCWQLLLDRCQNENEVIINRHWQSQIVQFLHFNLWGAIGRQSQEINDDQARFFDYCKGIEVGQTCTKKNLNHQSQKVWRFCSSHG